MGFVAQWLYRRTKGSSTEGHLSVSVGFAGCTQYASGKDGVSKTTNREPNLYPVVQFLRKSNAIDAVSHRWAKQGLQLL